MCYRYQTSEDRKYEKNNNLLFLKCFTYFFNVVSDIEPVQEGFLGANFMMITCFLTFNLTAMIGSITANIWQYVSRSKSMNREPNFFALASQYNKNCKILVVLVYLNKFRKKSKNG